MQKIDLTRKKQGLISPVKKETFRDILGHGGKDQPSQFGASGGFGLRLLPRRRFHPAGGKFPMIEILTSASFVAGRYFHLIAAALIVGGTLFYLWVVPFAIAELKEESQQIVFARARVVFRWIIFTSALLLLLSGAAMTARNLWIYQGKQIPLFREMARVSHPAAPPTEDLDHPSVLERPELWFTLHLVAALLCLIIAVALVRGGKPPHAPVTWMRVNFVLLLIAVFLAVMTRNARQLLFESVKPIIKPPPEMHD
jgi:hypothetical protein